MPIIINLRGTSGSGKTTAARFFLNNYTNIEMRRSVTSPKGRTSSKIMGYAIDVPTLQQSLYLVGAYGAVCGGLDTMGTQAEHADLILKAYSAGNVLCEGLLLSSVSSGATVPAAMIGAAGKERVIFAFMDTPLDVCLDRVRGRRAARGDDKPFNETNTRKKYEDTQAARQRLIDEGCRVVDISHLNPGPQLLSLYQDNE
jgi:thymidylate kinase